VKKSFPASAGPKTTKNSGKFRTIAQKGNSPLSNIHALEILAILDFGLPKELIELIYVYYNRRIADI
jgi:hypothetical protein